MNRRLLCLTCIFLLAALGAWPSAAIPPHAQITIENGSPYFVPATAIVAPGTPIRWDNPTPTHHTITHNGCVDGPACVFDSGTVEPDGSYTLPGLPSGRYHYHCRVHPIMQGILTITDQPALPSQT